MQATVAGERVQPVPVPADDRGDGLPVSAGQGRHRLRLVADNLPRRPGPAGADPGGHPPRRADTVRGQVRGGRQEGRAGGGDAGLGGGQRQEQGQGRGGALPPPAVADTGEQAGAAAGPTCAAQDACYTCHAQTTGGEQGATATAAAEGGFHPAAATEVGNSCCVERSWTGPAGGDRSAETGYQATGAENICAERSDVADNSQWADGGH